MKVIEPVAFSALADGDNKVCAFTTTRGDYSPHLQKEKPYQSFNVGLHVGDDEQQVLHHRQHLFNYLPKNAQIQWLNQVHGSDVYHLTHYSEQAITADAIYTQQPNIALAIMTADCLPILLTSDCGQEIAAIHAGWRPLAQGIIGNTLSLFTASTENIHVWLGPCISQKAFEVGAEVQQIFVKNNAKNAQAFKENPHQHNKYFADLPTLAKIELQAFGVKSIESAEQCTYSLRDKYYSYRRDQQTGRMATVIARYSC